MNKSSLTFEQWFAETARVLDIHRDVNHPSNRDYDYIAAFYAGVRVPKPGQELPSEHKDELSAKRYVPLGDSDNDMDFYDSKTGMSVGPQDVIVQDIKKENKLDNFLESESDGI